MARNERRPYEDEPPREPNWWDGVPLRDASLFLGAVVLAVLGGVLTVQTGHDWWLGLTVPLVVGYFLRWLVEDSPEMTRQNRAAVRKAWTRMRGPNQP